VAALGSAFFDTSILIAGLMEIGAASEYPQKIFSAIATRDIRGPLTAWHCCLEFYSVATRLPEEFRLDSDDALRLVEEEILARFDVRQLPDRAREGFLRELQENRVLGGRVYDAHIAEIARLSGAHVVVTENLRHFSALGRRGIRVMNSEEFARSSLPAG
jgi:predicted nucleic acid-binding protein